MSYYKFDIKKDIVDENNNDIVLYTHDYRTYKSGQSKTDTFHTLILGITKKYHDLHNKKKSDSEIANTKSITKKMNALKPLIMNSNGSVCLADTSDNYTRMLINSTFVLSSDARIDKFNHLRIRCDKNQVLNEDNYNTKTIEGKKKMDNEKQSLENFMKGIDIIVDKIRDDINEFNDVKNKLKEVKKETYSINDISVNTFFADNDTYCVGIPFEKVKRGDTWVETDKVNLKFSKGYREVSTKNKVKKEYNHEYFSDNKVNRDNISKLLGKGSILKGSVVLKWSFTKDGLVTIKAEFAAKSGVLLIPTKPAETNIEELNEYFDIPVLEDSDSSSSEEEIKPELEMLNAYDKESDEENSDEEDED